MNAPARSKNQNFASWFMELAKYEQRANAPHTFDREFRFDAGRIFARCVSCGYEYSAKYFREGGPLVDIFDVDSCKEIR